MEAELSPKEHSLSMKSREHKFDLPIAKGTFENKYETNCFRTSHI